MLSGALHTLILILILVVIIAAILAVVRAVATPRRATVVEEPVARQVPAASGLAPGWYPDQNDPSLMRYYDGRVWTAQTQPHA
jgi:hypothetical protein